MAKRQKQIPKPKPPWYQRPLALGGIALSVVSGAAALVANYKAIYSALFPERIEILIHPKTIHYNNAKDDKTGLVTTEITSFFNIVKRPEQSFRRCNFEVSAGSFPLPINSKMPVSRDFSLPPGRASQEMAVHFSYPPFFMRVEPTTLIVTCDGVVSKPAIVDGLD